MSTHFLKQKKTWFLILVLLILAGWAGVRRVRAKMALKEMAGLAPITVSKGDFVVKIQATGSVEPENRVPLGPTVGGRIEEILVKEGDAITKGSALATISSNERAALLDTVKIKGADPAEMKRVTEAYNLIPLVAPINGTIIKRAAEPGQSVGAGKEVLVISDRLIIKTAVDETDMGGVQEGQQVEFYLNAFPKDKHTGTVLSIAHDSTQKEGVNVYEVKVLPRGQLKELRSGMIADVYITTEIKRNTLYLPKNAITYKEGESFVLIKSQDGKKTDRKPVKVGKINEKNIEILSGATEADTVLYSTDTIKKEATGIVND